MNPTGITLDPYRHRDLLPDNPFNGYRLTQNKARQITVGLQHRDQKQSQHQKCQSMSQCILVIDTGNENQDQNQDKAKTLTGWHNKDVSMG
jgi:hypothetical protein